MPDEHAWASPALRAKLLADPVAVLRDRGINPPADLPTDIVHEFVRVLSLLWVEGRIVPVDRFYIDPADEGLLFGRGVWESTRTVNGLPWLWPMHLDRLRQSAEVVGIDLAPSRLPTDQQVRDYVRGLTTQDVLVRLNVSAGRPGQPGLVWMSAGVQPMAPASLRLKTVTNPIAKGQAYLTLKTFQYATRLRIGQSVTRAGFDTALLIDADGHVQEASHANIFLRFKDGWWTPTPDGGFLPGTVRLLVLSQSPLPIRERPIQATELVDVEEAFCTNSNVGVVPVTQIDDRPLPVGADTQGLIRWLGPLTGPETQYRFVERQGTPR